MSPPRPTAGPFRTPHTPLPPAPADYNLEQIIAARETADLDAAVQRSLQRYLLGRRQPERDCSWEDEGTAGLWWASVWMVCMVLYDVLSSQDKTSQLLSRKTKRSPLLSSPVQTSQLLSSPAETSQATSRQARDRPSKAKKRPSWARWGWSLILMLLACCYLLYSYRTQHGPSVTGGRVATAQRDSAADASSWDGVKWEDIRHLYRLTWDYRRPNKHLLGATHPLPDLEDCVQILHGAQWFAVIDLVDGYTQCQLSPESREMFSVATHDGVYTPTRVPMGAACSPSWFQAQMERAFAPILRRGALLYLDDLLIYATSFEQLMERLQQVMTIAEAHQLRLSAKKSTFVAQEVKWCGKLISGRGITHDPERINALINVPLPKNGGQLFSFLSAANWMRNHIPRYAQLQQPLLKLLAEVKKRAGSAKRARCSKIPLTQEIGWDDNAGLAFDKLKHALAHQTTLAHPDPEKEMLVITDASDTHWGGIVTQVPQQQWANFHAQRQVTTKAGAVVGLLPEDTPNKLALLDHEPIAFISGEFKKAQLNWAPVEKEAFALRMTLLRHQHICLRQRGVQVLTDHRNLQFLLAQAPSTPLAAFAVAKLQRWHISLLSIPYNIYYLPGEHNLWADLLSRWGGGASETPATRGDADTTLQACRVLQLLYQVQTRQRTRQQPAEPTERHSPPPAHATDMGAPARRRGRPKAEPRRQPGPTLPQPAASRQGTQLPLPVPPPEAPPASAEPTGATPQPATGRAYLPHPEPHTLVWPTLAEIKHAQEAAMATTPPPPAVVIDAKGVARFPPRSEEPGPIWLPTTARELIIRVMIVAHADDCVHATTDVTLRLLRRYFCWRRMATDVNNFTECLHCLRGGNNKVVPRPLGETMSPRRPNHIVHMDYVELDAAIQGFKYILVVKDGFTQFTRLYMTKTESAAFAAQCLRDWFSYYSVPMWLVSDGGSHFTARVLKRLAVDENYKHKITPATCPWTNGVAENMVKQVVKVLRTLHSVHTAQEREYHWPQLVTIVERRLNDVPLPGVDHTPREAFLNPSTGRRAPILDDDALMTDAEAPIDPAAADVNWEPLLAAWKQLCGCQRNRNEHLRELERRRRVKKAGALPSFRVGDFVLVGRIAHKRNEKLHARWLGPFRVMNTKKGWTHVVQSLVNPAEVYRVHVTRMKFYCEAWKGKEQALTTIAAASASSTTRSAVYDVEHISALAYNHEARRWECRVRWLGFEEAESTKEPLEDMVKAVPEFVLAAMKESQPSPTADLQRRIWSWMPDANWKEKCQKAIDDMAACAPPAGPTGTVGAGGSNTRVHGGSM
eukprot:GHVU01191441.1.p1 GENE.GHVU01191441.1~~GHVU01191441.1.p1  ORF type:complete len:1485 (+),score=177.77 GHVU01191441.1:529-4455(+)